MLTVLRARGFTVPEGSRERILAETYPTGEPDTNVLDPGDVEGDEPAEAPVVEAKPTGKKPVG